MWLIFSISTVFLVHSNYFHCYQSISPLGECSEESKWMYMELKCNYYNIIVWSPVLWWYWLYPWENQTIQCVLLYDEHVRIYYTPGGCFVIPESCWRDQILLFNSRKMNEHIQSISGCLFHHGKMTIQTDQSNASYTEISPSMANLIVQFASSFFCNVTSNLKSTVSKHCWFWSGWDVCMSLYSNGEALHTVNRLLYVFIACVSVPSNVYAFVCSQKGL